MLSRLCFGGTELFLGRGGGGGCTELTTMRRDKRWIPRNPGAQGNRLQCLHRAGWGGVSNGPQGTRMLFMQCNVLFSPCREQRRTTSSKLEALQEYLGSLQGVGGFLWVASEKKTLFTSPPVSNVLWSLQGLCTHTHTQREPENDTT